ncbi:hypothetical protein BDR05DRAFT_951859 [Suillus weaverae]|nr:hypothetical protein BDR05DRAFT_951859 [Suillus weaverae]
MSSTHSGTSAGSEDTLAKNLLSNNSDTMSPTTSESPTKANSTLTISALSVSSAEANSTPTVIVDEADGYAEIDAALAMGSVLNVHKSTYFNVPMDPKDGVTLYYITRGRKLGVFSGW